MTKALFLLLLGPLSLAVGCNKKYTPDDLVVGDGSRPDFTPGHVYLKEADKAPVLWSSIGAYLEGIERKSEGCVFSDSAPRKITIEAGHRFPHPLRVALGSEQVVFESANTGRLAFTKQDWPSLFAAAALQTTGDALSATLRLPLQITLPGHPAVERAITLSFDCAVQPFLTTMIQQPSNEGVAVSPEARGWLTSYLLNPPHEAYHSTNGTTGSQKPLRYSFRTDARTLGDIRYVVRRVNVQFDGNRCRTHSRDVRKFKSTLEVYDRGSGKLVAEKQFTTSKDRPCERETLCTRPEDFIAGTCIIPAEKGCADDPFDWKAESAWIETQKQSFAGRDPRAVRRNAP